MNKIPLQPDPSGAISTRLDIWTKFYTHRRRGSDGRREFGRRPVSGVTKDAFRTEDGGFDLTAFKACRKGNGIEPLEFDQNKHGWRGRFGICAGLMLRRVAKKNGFVVIDGKMIAAHGVKKRGRIRKAKSSNGGEP